MRMHTRGYTFCRARDTVSRYAHHLRIKEASIAACLASIDRLAGEHSRQVAADAAARSERIARRGGGGTAAGVAAPPPAAMLATRTASPATHPPSPTRHPAPPVAV